MKHLPEVPEAYFVKIHEVLVISALSKASIYDAVKKGTFPAPVKVGVRAVAWVRSEVLEWAAMKVRKSREMAAEDCKK
ncbi:AlpA family phage regulatory protein [Massilia sp. DJPM01]|uniref:helix-turn-helix transcriptional regulator n=1 Tax=Massilia sp. DJPM01 TaxID=3024404 RepID=UPI00259F29DA|nr:AlpA family phage regulatory protein [Massilia sp. DJPM01]MDM5177840.1 AlpA family phage regulatory protein [Massilia sp. DJPM01]